MVKEHDYLFIPLLNPLRTGSLARNYILINSRLFNSNGEL